MPGGRPTKYDPSRHPDLAFWMAHAGLTDEQMAKEFGVATSTLYEWRSVHPEFSDAAAKGKATPDDEVEAALFRLARGYTRKNAKGREISVPPEIRAIIFWLKNRRPDRWRDKQIIGHEGPVSVRVIGGSRDAGDQPEDTTRGAAALPAESSQEADPPSGEA